MVKIKKIIERIRRQSGYTGESDEYVDLAPDAREPPVDARPVPVKKPWLSRKKSGQQREDQIEVLQQGYSEMLGMVRSIRSNLDRQSQYQDKLLSHLEHLPEALDGLKGITRAGEQQAQVVGLIRDQLEQNADQQQIMSDSMNRFNDTLGLMDANSRSSAETIRALTERAGESEDILRYQLERSERRLVMLNIGLLLLTIGVLASAWYFLRGQGSGILTAGVPEQSQPADRFEETLKAIEPAIPPRSSEPDPAAGEEAQASVQPATEGGWNILRLPEIPEELFPGPGRLDPE